MSKNKIKRVNHKVLFERSSRPYGQSYAKWTEKWWQWAFSIPKDVSPIIDSTGENCAKGQWGPVWFLAGTTNHIFNAKRSCVIPRRKSMLFPLIVSQFSRSEKPAMTDTELIRYSAKDIDQTSLLEVVVDDLNLTNLAEYRVQSFFSLNLVEANIWDIRPGPTMAASDGFWVFLKPLSVGTHTINFRGIEPNFETNVTYDLTII